MEKQRGLSATTLKWIAITAMALDHFAWLFVPTASLAGQLLHTVGRLTAPIMSFCIAEGYYHTRNIKKYLVRLGLFAAISHIPFTFFATHTFVLVHNTGVLYTLFLALAALAIVNAKALPGLVKATALLVIFLLSVFGDWQYYIIVWVLIFGLVRENKAVCMLFFGATALLSALEPMLTGSALYSNYLYGFGVLLAIPILLMYNGQRGKFPMRYFFYFFYPLHLIVLTLCFIYIKWA